MAISNNIYDRDKAAYKENTLDGGLDRRVTDVTTHSKLDSVINALGGTTSTEITYNEVTSVAASVLTTIVSYTAASNKTTKSVTASGTNIAQYELVLNGNVIDKMYTNFGTALNVEFNGINGLDLIPGDVLLIRVTHNRGSVGNFSGKIVVQA